MIAVRDEILDVSDEKVSDEEGCLSRSMTINAHNRIAVPLTPETKDSINKESLMRVPKGATLINAECPEEVHVTEMLEVLKSATRLLSPLRCANREC